METFELEKTDWDDNDFEAMGWHDATLWSIHPNPDEHELLLDLDYIFQWVNPGEGETYFKFWVAPVTMVFENAFNLNLDIESPQGTIEIADLHRETVANPTNPNFVQRNYRFECQEGEITLSATGYRMYVRQPPILLESQSLTLSQRGGIRFDRMPSPA